MIEAMPVINNADFRALEAEIINPPSEQRWEIPANRLKEFGIDDDLPPPPTAPPRITPGILNFYGTACRLHGPRRGMQCIGISTWICKECVGVDVTISGGPNSDWILKDAYCTGATCTGIAFLRSEGSQEGRQSPLNR